METRRLRLEGTSLPQLRARVLAEHGEAARIVSAEQVTVGGIRGFFAKRHIEVTVDVPVGMPVRRTAGRPEGSGVFVQVDAGRRRPAHARDELSTRLGIAALLDDADAAEARVSGVGALPPLGATPGELRVEQHSPAGAPEVPSTATPDFARLMDDLTFATSPGRRAPGSAPAGAGREVPAAAAATTDKTAVAPSELPPEVSPEVPVEVPVELAGGAPRLLTGPGDLVLLVGLRQDVVEAARLLGIGEPAPLDGGLDLVTDRRSALAARARGVARGRSVLVGRSVPVHHGTEPASGTPMADSAAPGAAAPGAAVPGAAAPGFAAPGVAAPGVAAPGVAAPGAAAPGSAVPGAAGPGSAAPDSLAALGADQVWAVVHAGRKPADTARWVRATSALVTIDAVAVLGAETTATPGTVRELGLPIGWLAPAAGPAAAPASAAPANPVAIG